MDNKWIIITGTSLFPDHKRQWIMCPYCKATYHIWMKTKRKCDICGNKVKGTITEEEYMKKENDDFSERVDDILRQMDADYEPVKAIPSAEPCKGMTNGQVHDMLYQMLVELNDGADRYGAEKWWNSPYNPQDKDE